VNLIIKSAQKLKEKEPTGNCGKLKKNSKPVGNDPLYGFQEENLHFYGCHTTQRVQIVFVVIFVFGLGFIL